MSQEYTFGRMERLGAATLMSILTILTVSNTVLVYYEHISQPHRIGVALNILFFAQLSLIGIVYFGRPIWSHVPKYYNKAKAVIA